MNPAPPSTIARSVAAAMWPDVQIQRKLSRGAYAFTCAGHGGIIGIVDELSLPTEVVNIARRAGLIHVFARVNHGGRRMRSYLSAVGYRADELRAMAERHPNAVQLVEVWIAEEDCDWATLAYVSDAVREGIPRSGYSSAVDRDYVRDSLTRWNGDYLTALDAIAA